MKTKTKKIKTRSLRTIDKEFRKAFDNHKFIRCPYVLSPFSINQWIIGFERSIERVKLGEVGNSSPIIVDGFNAGHAFTKEYFDSRREEIDRSLEKEFGWILNQGCNDEQNHD